MKTTLALYVDSQTSSTALLTDILLANSFNTRLLGYMFQNEAASKGILFKPCNSLHSFFMRFDLDLYFLDENDCLLHVEKNFSKNQMLHIKNAAQVLETPSGTISYEHLELGQRFYFKTLT